MVDKKRGFGISERPILTSKEDCFDITSRFVEKIYNFIQGALNSQFTIAIGGEWGVGKSSAINILKDKLEKDSKRNIILTFEPLLEGKLEVAEVIELFYIKLYQSLNNESTKEVVKRCLKSVLIVSRFKATAEAKLDTSILGLPGVNVDGNIEYDWGKNVDDLLKLWEKQMPKSLAVQNRELNEILKDQDYKLYIFIDEIDRLPAHYIINILLFCRVLEMFDNLVCIVGLDYEKVIIKLNKESHLRLDNVELAQSYLDKLFQIKYNISHNKIKLMEYGVNQLREIDHENVLSSLLKTSDYLQKEILKNIFLFLATPRLIKKWLIALIARYPFLKNLKDKLSFMAFLAVITKHPIIADYLAKYTIEMLDNELILTHFIKNKYDVEFGSLGVDIPDDIFRKGIFLASLGVKYRSSGVIRPGKAKYKEFEEKLNDLMLRLKVECVDECFVSQALIEYLNSPRYLIISYVEGLTSEDQVKLCENFFEKDVNQVIEFFMSEENNIDSLAYDLAETLQEKRRSIKETPSMKLLNELWLKKVNEISFFASPYAIIVSRLLVNLPVDKVISEAHISLSESYVVMVLDVLDIKNKKGKIELSDFKKFSQTNITGMEKITFQNISIVDFTKETVRAMLAAWLIKFENNFISNSHFLPLKPHLSRTFDRYIQWKAVLGEEGEEKLANLLISFLKNNKVETADKSYIKELVKKEQEKFDFQSWGVEKSPYEFLFNNNAELIKLLSS